MSALARRSSAHAPVLASPVAIHFSTGDCHLQAGRQEVGGTRRLPCRARATGCDPELGASVTWGRLRGQCRDHREVGAELCPVVARGR